MDMFTYNAERLNEALLVIIREYISEETFQWLLQQKGVNNISAFNTAFAIMPRKTGRSSINIAEVQEELLQATRPGFTINNWTVDRLCRVWLLINMDARDKEVYFNTIEKLFSAAEMNELVALYSALPLLPYAGLWVKRCAEGIRSNIGTVLEAIMYHNPYAADNLGEAAWNQMVLKAFFTEKQIDLIYGLNERENQELARILIDYADERKAAGRSVDPMLWYLVNKHVDGIKSVNVEKNDF